MPTYSEPVNRRRRFPWWAKLILLVVVLYGGALYFAAHQARVYLNAVVAPPGTNAPDSCAEYDFTGLPARVSAVCKSAKFVDPVTGIDLSTGTVRTTTFVHDPLHATFSIASPVKAKFANGLTTDTNWQNLDSDIGGDLTGITHGLVQIGKIDSTVTLPSGPTPLKITSDHAELNVRQNGPDLDISSRSEGSKVETGFIPVNLPVFSTSLEATLDGRGNVLSGAPIVAGEAIQGDIKRLAINFGSNGTLAVSGPFRIAENGLLTGDLTIDVENYAALQATLSKSFPRATTIIDTASILLKSLSADGKTGKVTLNIRDGRVQLGIIPLGVIPPL
ncbi:DUF2125 domain-containing protein [Rhizobium sp. C4]|uniref:DUF2125 domain-containing protein n=1 Tax=Rhizobium sp. C4 TaxID=1349800 RepID=UPI001E64241C|nr:DUF2125 domain-containing protein [Rhizobium sp. C4]MCD2175686.1 DUF2125 domain-containing protein [Rhizobium sp. C4]